MLSVEATEYEPVLGQAALSIFLTGRTTQETYPYLVLVTGTADAGYLVSDFRLVTGPDPPSDLRQKL
ncbi:MAG: hypothetical protein KKA32_03230 [Actinobacteria bacterium]|nr:hypothetical protein [Actinomycetota bacterium]